MALVLAAAMIVRRQMAMTRCRRRVQSRLIKYPSDSPNDLRCRRCRGRRRQKADQDPQSPFSPEPKKAVGLFQIAEHAPRRAPVAAQHLGQPSQIDSHEAHAGTGQLGQLLVRGLAAERWPADPP